MAVYLCYEVLGKAVRVMPRHKDLAGSPICYFYLFIYFCVFVWTVIYAETFPSDLHIPENELKIKKGLMVQRFIAFFLSEVQSVRIFHITFCLIELKADKIIACQEWESKQQQKQYRNNEKWCYMCAVLLQDGTLLYHKVWNFILINCDCVHVSAVDSRWLISASFCLRWGHYIWKDNGLVKNK